MSPALLGLLAARRFWPLFWGQFLGALNDNLVKNAVAVLIVFRLGAAESAHATLVVTAAAGLFILPFFLFSAWAGELADSQTKARLIAWVKLAEMPAMALAALALGLESQPLMLAVLFLLGLQATFFGPLKYGILPELLAPAELVGGNALVEGGTFLAILLGSIAGSLLVLRPTGTLGVGVLAVLLAALGWLAVRLVPPTPTPQRRQPLSRDPVGATWALLTEAKSRPGLLPAMLGISWFWLMGATYLTQFPAFAKATLAVDETVVTLFLTLFSLGIGLGSTLCARALKGQASWKPVPWAALGMSLFGLDLAWAAGPIGGGGGLAGIGDFLTSAQGWRLSLDLVGLAAMGGAYTVPLYTFLQLKARPENRARAIAANNVLNAAFMVVSAAASAALLGAGLGVPGLFLALAAANLAAAAALAWAKRTDERRAKA